MLDRGFEPWSSQNKEYEIGICCFSAKHSALRSKSKTGWLEIGIMCQSGVACLPTDCCFSELALYNPTKCVGLVQSEHQWNVIVLAMI